LHPHPDFGEREDEIKDEEQDNCCDNLTIKKEVTIFKVMASFFCCQMK
jgi:hypothetical protein